MTRFLALLLVECMESTTAGASNSFSSAGHIYVREFDMGQTLLKEKLLISVAPKRFACRQRKAADEILQHTSCGMSCRVAQNDADLKKNVMLVTTFQPSLYANIHKVST